ncbi:MAG: flippase, partial [Nanoarchaeota archaeon]
EKFGEENHRKSISKDVFRNSLYNLLATLINRIGGLIFTVVVARILMPDLFGAYSLVLSILLIGLTVADFGLAQTSIRFVSDALGKKDERLARSYFKFILNVKILITLAISIILFLVAGLLSVFIFKNEALILPMKLSALYLFFVSLLDFLSFTFFTLKDVKYYFVKEIFYQILRISLIIPVVIVIASELKVSSIFVVLTIISILMLIYTIYIIRSKFGFILKGEIVRIDKKRILKFSMFLAIGILPGIFFTYVDTLMIGALMPIRYVGFYRAAYTIATSIGSLFMFYMVVLPYFTQFEHEVFDRAFKKIFHLTSVIAFPASFGLALVAAPFIKLLYGPEYLPATLPLYLLAFLIIDVSLFTYFISIFQAKENPEIIAKVVGIAAILNIILNYFLIISLSKVKLEYGMLGAAIATIISRFFAGIYLAIVSAKKFNIKPAAQSIYKPLIASIVMALALILMPDPSSIFVGVIEIIAAAVIYFVVLFLIKGITKEDISYVWDLFKK